MIIAKKAKATQKLVAKKVPNQNLVPTLVDGVNQFTVPKQGFKILQLTDVHIGNTLVTRKQDVLAINAIITLVEYAKPDLIICTGDNVYPMVISTGTTNNLRQTKRFARVLEAFEIPWATVFGNHDTEVLSRYSKQQLGEYYSSLPHCLFQAGEKQLTGVGNYSIKLVNDDGSINMLLMLLDSNMYRAGNFFTGFDSIHDDQIEWYEKTVKKFSSDKAVVPSLAFFHMPLVEYKEAWNLLRFGSDEVQYNLGWIGEKDNYVGIARERSNFFNRMLELGSLKGTFVGHDHLNTISMTYKGIRLSYGMSIDYLAYKGIMRQHTQRGASLITVMPDSTFDLQHISLSKLQIGTWGNDVVR